MIVRFLVQSHPMRYGCCVQGFKIQSLYRGQLLATTRSPILPEQCRRCSRRDSNPRPFVRETNVITNYTTRAQSLEPQGNEYSFLFFSAFTRRRSLRAGVAPRTPSVRHGHHTRARYNQRWCGEMPAQRVTPKSDIGQAHQF